MEFNFKKFIITLFILIFAQTSIQCDCGIVSAAQVVKEQQFNTTLSKILANTPDVEIPQQFQSVAFKTLRISETLRNKKNRRQFIGVRVLRDMFSEDRHKFDTTYVYLSKDKPIIAHASSTWHVNHTPNSGIQYHLYYQRTPVTEAMNEGDLLFVAKANDDKIFIIIADDKSPAKDKLLTSFNEVSDTEGKKVSNVVTTPLQIQPTVSWYKVYFTPGLDCENNIISRLNGAKKTVDIAVYSITNENIVNAVIAAHKRGVKVRVMTDNVQSQGRSSRVKQLINAGIPVRTNQGSGHKIEHNKFAIFDGKEMETGSYNWTNSATKSNSENCMFFKQTDKGFSSRYEELWKFYTEGNAAACK